MSSTPISHGSTSPPERTRTTSSACACTSMTMARADRRPTWWLLFVFACGGSNLRQHATAADVSATLLVDLSTQISAAWRDAELAALGASRTQEDAQEGVAEVRARYAPLGIAYEAVRLA